MHGTRNLRFMQKWRSLALYHAACSWTPAPLLMSLLPLFLPSAGSSLPAALQPAEPQGSLTNNRIDSAPSLFHHLYSPAFSLATGGSYITLWLQGTASTQCPCLCLLEACSVSKLPKRALLSTAWSPHIPSPCSVCPQQVTQPVLLPLAVCRNCLLLWGDGGDLLNQPGLNPLQQKLLPFEFSCWPEETNPSAKPAQEGQIYWGEPAGQGTAKELKTYFPSNFSNSFWHHRLAVISINSRCTCCGWEFES